MGDADVVADEIQAFLTGDREPPPPHPFLATVPFTDIVDSTARSAVMGDRAWRPRGRRTIGSSETRSRAREAA